MEKMAKFWSFFGKKGRYTSKNFIFDKILVDESGEKKMEENWQNCHFLVIFEVKKGPVY